MLGCSTNLQGKFGRSWGINPSDLDVLETILCDTLVVCEIDVHEIENEFCRVCMKRHRKPEGLEVRLNARNGTEIMRLAAREQKELVEKLECGC